MGFPSIRSVQDAERMLLLSRDFEQELEAACAQLETETVTASSIDGMVTVTVGGMGKIQSVRVDPAVFDDGDKAALEFSIAQALTTAAEQASRLASARIGPTRITLH